jgi:hypothetical protein
MKRIQFLIAESIGRDEVARKARAQIVFRRWSEIVGADLAERSYPDRYSKGTVWVAVTGSAWAQELRMMKDVILRRLLEASGEQDLFKEVRIGVRPIRRPETEGTEVGTSIDEDLRKLSIPQISERRLRNWPHEKRD